MPGGPEDVYYDSVIARSLTVFFRVLGGSMPVGVPLVGAVWWFT